MRDGNVAATLRRQWIEHQLSLAAASLRRADASATRKDDRGGEALARLRVACLRERLEACDVDPDLGQWLASSEPPE
jgi:hypothetical protein